MKNVYSVWMKDILQYFKQLKIKLIFKIKFPKFDGIELYLFNYKIKNLPDLPNLKLLDLGACKIETIPSFKKLINLDLHFSNIQIIPDLPNLEILYLGDSNVKILGDFPKLRRFHIEESLIKDNGNWIFSDKIGSRNMKTIYNKKYDKIFCGCFKGTLDEFIDKVHETYTEGHTHRIEYDNFINLIKSKI